MSKQICVSFYRHLGDKYVDEQVNEYLANHPTHRIQLVDYEKAPDSSKEAVFVVFEAEVED